MDIIEQIGAFAGLAAVLGLAVLSALYFSQARDVRRLREWAGRAPERAAEGAAAEQLAQGVVAQPQPKVVQEATKPAAAAAAAATPAAAAGAKPAAAAAAAGGNSGAQKAPRQAPAAVPAPAGAQAATPAAAQAATPAGAVAEGGSQAGAATAAPPAPQAPVKPADGGQPPAQAPKVPGTGPPKPPTAAPPKPPTTPRLPARPSLPSRRGAPVASQTAILPPSGTAAPPWYRQLLASPRYLVLAIAGVLVFGAAGAFGIVQLTGEDDEVPAGQRAVGQAGSGGEDDRGPRAAPIDPSQVTVSVLNGTTIPGLAASVGDRVEANGFVLGNVTNSAEQGEKAESVVLFADGAEREAIAVGRRLGIAQRAPIDPESQALGGDASVVVITGNDLTQ